MTSSKDRLFCRWLRKRRWCLNPAGCCKRSRGRPTFIPSSHYNFVNSILSNKTPPTNLPCKRAATSCLYMQPTPCAWIPAWHTPARTPLSTWLRFAGGPSSAKGSSELGALFHHPLFYDQPAWSLLRFIRFRKKDLFGYLGSGKIASGKNGISVIRVAEIGKLPGIASSRLP